MLERIWSGWRARATSAPIAWRLSRSAELVHTASSSRASRRRDAHRAPRRSGCFGILNIYPYTAGHLLVLPYREVADLADLTAAETGELWATVTDAVDRPFGWRMRPTV